jgi:hypothetical protein
MTNKPISALMADLLSAYRVEVTGKESVLVKEVVWVKATELDLVVE